MELKLLDINRHSVGFIDTFKSLLWVDRYYTFGDFEFQAVATSDLLAKLSNTAYLIQKDSPHVMLFESLEIKTSVDNGKDLFVKGRSMEAFFEQRHIWNPGITLEPAFQDAFMQLIFENIQGQQEIPDRNAPEFDFLESDDPLITGAPGIDYQPVMGDSLYKVVMDMCIARGIGWRIVLTSDLKFQIGLYAGADRSHDQIDNPYVVFSPNTDNLISGDYIATNQFYKTIAHVAGVTEDDGSRIQVTVTIPGGGGVGLARREMFVDASDMPRTTSEGTLTEAEYIAKLEERGRQELAKQIFIESFDGQIDVNTTQYAYREDFFMGDIVQIADEFGHQAKSRVTEVIHSQDPSGAKIYPTFTNY